MISNHSDTRPGDCFRPILDERVFEHAPVLQPQPEEACMANQAFARAQYRLPTQVAERLQARQNETGHPIRPLRYYPFPIVFQENADNPIHQGFAWGDTYASIVRKIVRAYRRPRSGIRRFLQASLLQFIPEHLLELLEAYRTLDDLAGSHMGDDHIGGRSIEWNVGAVGGLDEGHLVSKAVDKNLPKRHPGNTLGSPLETDPLPLVREAIRWAYESHCLANNRPAKNTPLIAFLEHDDLYGSTVSLCARLKKAGEKTLIAFEQELDWQEGRLFCAGYGPVDIAYCDCHLEDLGRGHPLLQACETNTVALDTSPLARLVMRSKVIMALLQMPRFQKELDLTTHEISRLTKHLVPTFLWCRKTFTNPPSFLVPGLSALCAGSPYKTQAVTIPQTDAPEEQPLFGLVTKVAIGGVYGGSAVEVSARTPKGYDTRSTFALLLKHLEPLAMHYTRLEAKQVFVRTRPEIKSLIKEEVLRSLGRGLGIEPPDDPFWAEINRLCLAAFDAPTESPLSAKDILLALEPPVRAYFEIDLSSLRRTSAQLFKPLERFLDRLLQKTPLKHNEQSLMSSLLRQFGLVLARARFQMPEFVSAFGDLLEALRAQINMDKAFSCHDLAQELIELIDSFFLNQFGKSFPESGAVRLQSILLQPYLQRRFLSLNPVVFQPHVHPEPLVGERDLYLMNRIHILFTKDGKNTRLAGTQVFYLKDGKAENSSKMTASLWAQG